MLPFYILHQVAVATAGTIVAEWNAGVAVKFVVISGVAFATTMLTYEFLVRRSRPLRRLFGLKPMRRRERSVDGHLRSRFLTAVGAQGAQHESLDTAHLR